ncbi:hypothetical protein PPACK8108_LOCUS20863 [Phakopsora pachyrhizi]|uniref:Uncharacterized protein n=1 Tax=Phakopsora pachyrhizi TaxID=170000 RepID=A0AAV0BI51_PHAPC|nr:hypothetical protein PPACK8108_LOCUS20863 [Phakopsora pachyrhizi]
MTDNEQVLEGGDDADRLAEWGRLDWAGLAEEWAAGYKLGRDWAGLDCWSGQAGLGWGIEQSIKQLID